MDFNNDTGLIGSVMTLSPPPGGLLLTGTDGIVIPNGNTSSRPSAPLTGTLRFNTDSNSFELWNSSTWAAMGTVTASSIVSILGYTPLGNPNNSLAMPAGATNSPSLYFNGTQTGLYEVSANTIGFTSGGNSVGYISNVGLNNMAIGSTSPSTGAFTNVAISGSLNLNAGTPNSPSLYFNGTQTGLYEVSSNTLGFSAGGNSIGYMSPTGLNNIAVGVTSPSTGAFTSLSTTNGINVPSGSSSSPSLFFNGTNTGIYQYGSNIIGFTAGGNGVGYISNVGLNNMAIGATSPSTGVFTSLSASSLSLSSLNNTPIGSTTPSTGSFTTLTANSITVSPGTTTAAAIDLTPGVVLSTPTTGGVEYDGINLYFTNDLTSGRGRIPVEQSFRLTSAGTAIGTSISNFFGANSNIPLSTGGYYEIEIIAYYTKTTASTVTWTFTNSSAPSSQNIHYEMSPIAGIVAPPGTATTLMGDVYNNTAAVYSFVTGSIANNSIQTARFKIYLNNNAGTSLKIQATSTSGSLTPGINSRWTAKRISPNNVGTFAA